MSNLIDLEDLIKTSEIRRLMIKTRVCKLELEIEKLNNELKELTF